MSQTTLRRFFLILNKNSACKTKIYMLETQANEEFPCMSADGDSVAEMCFYPLCLAKHRIL